MGGSGEQPLALGGEELITDLIKSTRVVVIKRLLAGFIYSYFFTFSTWYTPSSWAQEQMAPPRSLPGHGPKWPLGG